MSELSDFFPRFLLNDKNGYALACALLRGMTITGDFCRKR